MGNGAFLRPTCLQNRRRLPCLACRTSQTERRSIFCWRLFTLPQMKTLFPTANGNPSRPAFRRGNKRKMRRATRTPLRVATPAELITTLAASICCKRERDRKSTRLNSSHGYISYAVFCLKKKKNQNYTTRIVRQTDHLNGLIENVLAIYCTLNNRLELNLTDVRLRAFVQTTFLTFVCYTH